MPIPEATVDELIALIKKSNVINVIIEGKDDIVAYRALERDVNRDFQNSISLISAGGRTKVLEILCRLEGTPEIERCIFICDKDTWVFSGTPSNGLLAKVITTDGYSIENDIARDYPPTEFMDNGEREDYFGEMDYYSQWFAIEVQAALSGGQSELSRYPGLILDTVPRVDLSSAVAPDGIAHLVFETIKNDREKFLRGKSVVQIAMRQLARKGRISKHHHLTYLEHGAARRGELFSRIITAVRSQVAEISKPGV